eukprot:1625620-Pyramimonas_sp.AAC.1
MLRTNFVNRTPESLPGILETFQLKHEARNVWNGINVQAAVNALNKQALHGTHFFRERPIA